MSNKGRAITPEELRKRQEAISKRKSVSVQAGEWGTSAQTLNWILKKRGRLEGEPGNYRVSEKYREFEHPVQGPYPGNSYDPEFFEGIRVSREDIERAERELKEYRRLKKIRQEQEREQYYRKMKQGKQLESSHQVNTRVKSSNKGILSQLLSFLSK